MQKGAVLLNINRHYVGRRLPPFPCLESIISRIGGNSFSHAEPTFPSFSLF